MANKAITLSDVRRNRMMTVKDLAKALRISGQHLLDIERGSTRPAPGLAENMAFHYDIALEQFWLCWENAKKIVWQPPK